jgi:uncharacterized membrane-anchored protein
MPLSDDEQRKLDQIERALAEDPGFADSVSIERIRRRRLILAAAVFTIGVVLLLAGLVTTSAALVAGVILSAVGVLTMTTGIVLFFWRRYRT